MSHSKSFRFTGDTFKAAPTARFARWQIHPTSTTSGDTCRILATKPDFWPFIAEQLSLLNDLTLVHGILRSLYKTYHTSHSQASAECSYIKRHGYFCAIWILSVAKLTPQHANSIIKYCIQDICKLVWSKPIS